MTSNVNPNNIDTAFPIAGQDNDSQGFRDNFTNIKNNFAYTEDEVTDLQSKVILKSALTGTSLDNDFDGALITAALITDIRESVTALGTTNGTVTLNHAAGHYQTVTADGSITLAFSNLPAAGTKGRIQLAYTVGSVADTLTLPAAVTLGTAVIRGISGQVITFPETGTFIFEFTTSNAGTTIHIADLSRQVKPNASSEDLASAGAASVVTDISYFTTAASETATLAAGTAGQIKMFSAVDITSGNMVITVTNAGWKASGTGTITFSARGAGCTLCYVASKWFCVGNNGAAFA